MSEWFEGLGPLSQALLAGGFTWALLAPAEATGTPPWLPPTVGFVLGAGFLALMDKLLPHLHLGLPTDQAEGVSVTWKRTTLLVIAITLHNVPEGLAVGLELPAAATLAGAVTLAVGIGLQNLPEGVVVALPLRREGLGRFQSFLYGQLSALVEPLVAVSGAAATSFMRPLLLYALAFAAGAMVFVVVEELIPTSQRSGHTDVATLGTVARFTLMMILDVALG